MTECTQSSFGFREHFSRAVVARFDGGTTSSDGGGILLRQVDQRLDLVRRLVHCFRDERNPERIHHSLQELLAQRIYGLALGYEDLNDHEQLRHDPLLAVLAGRKQAGAEPLAGKSTLNRLELSQEQANRYQRIGYQSSALDDLLVDLFLEAHAEPPQQIVLDLDVTDLPLHGHQEGRFFHGYYDSYCYLPLYIFCGEHLLCARLRTAGQDAAAGCLAEVERIVSGLRQRWPQVQILLRADSGFCREELMHWCEQQPTPVEYVFGLARNPRLRAQIEQPMQAALQQHTATGKPARVFSEFAYQTLQTWSRERRVVAKAEHLEGKENPRFVVTSLPAQSWPAQPLYETLYCARGEMENRIKEQLMLFADRVSAQSLRANQLRLYFSAFAYVLLHALRRLALQGTVWAHAQAHTLRLHLLKIGAQIRITARKIWISLPSSYPWQALFAHAWSQLRC